jgi:hypothetical protein
VKLAIHLHVVSRTRISGVVPLLLNCALLARTRTHFEFTLPSCGVGCLQTHPFRAAKPRNTVAPRNTLGLIAGEKMNENGNVIHGPLIRVACPPPPSLFTHNVTSLKGASDSSYFNVLHSRVGGQRWRRWLRHRATSQRVTGLIPYGFIGILH